MRKQAGRRTRTMIGMGILQQWGLGGSHRLATVAGLALGLWASSAAATRGPEVLPVPGIRLEVGPHLLVPQPAVPDPVTPVDPLVLPDRGARLTLGIQLQVAVLWFHNTNRLSAWGLFPELGYMYQRRDQGTTALFNAGLGLGYMPSPWVYFAYIPRFVVGRVYGADASGNASPDLYRSALGVRHGLQVGLLAGVVTAELAHQFLGMPGRNQDELIAMFGIDVLRLGIIGFLVGLR